MIVVSAIDYIIITLQQYGVRTAPFVSGVAALVKSKNLSMAPLEIRKVLAYNAIDLGYLGRDRIYGFGLIQAG